MAVEVIRKAFLVLERLAESITPLPLADLSRKTNLPKATIYRILQTLLEMGYIAQEKETGFYFRTAKLSHIGNDSQTQELKNRALPYMKKMFNKFNETVNLGILQGTNVYYLHFIETTQQLRNMVKPDTIDTYYSTALGKAIAAFLPEQEKNELIEQTKFEANTPNTVKNKSRLRNMLVETKRQGWSVDNQENAVGVICFGVPFLNNGYPEAAISISLPKIRLTKQLEKEIKEELKKISRL